MNTPKITGFFETDRDKGSAMAEIVIGFRISAENGEIEVPIAPLLEALYTIFQEPCIVLSEEETREEAKLWDWPYLDPFMLICTASELVYAIADEHKGKAALTVAEYDPYKARQRQYSAVTQNVLEIKPIRNHGGGCLYKDDHNTFKVLGITEEAKLWLELIRPLQEYHEVIDPCGFALAITLRGSGTPQFEEYADKIEEALRKAYSIE